MLIRKKGGLGKDVDVDPRGEWVRKKEERRTVTRKSKRVEGNAMELRTVEKRGWSRVQANEEYTTEAAQYTPRPANVGSAY